MSSYRALYTFLFAVITPGNLTPNFSLNNITYYYEGYLEEWVEFFYLEPIWGHCLHNVKLLIYVIFVLCFH